MGKKRPKLTDKDWVRVFELRCLTKRTGTVLSREDSMLIRRAFAEDPERYGDLNQRVFEATKPFGAK